LTLAEFQPYVEQAIVALEWNLARARRVQRLTDERESIARALPLAEMVGLERAPMEARLDQIEVELTQDVTPDWVSVHPLRSVPMDMIATAVVRRLLRVPPEFPILSIKALPPQDAVDEVVMALALKWQTPNGPSSEEPTRIESHV